MTTCGPALRRTAPAAGCRASRHERDDKLVTGPHLLTAQVAAGGGGPAEGHHRRPPAQHLVHGTGQQAGIGSQLPLPPGWSGRAAQPCAKLGLYHAPNGACGLWVATLGGSFKDLDGSGLRTQPGVIAVPFLGAAAAGMTVDVSLVVADWWRRPAAPKPAQREYVVVDLTAGGTTFKAVSGMTLK